jgi:uncharacterized protein (TIGR02270 family)
MAEDRLIQPPVTVRQVIEDTPYLWLAREATARESNPRLFDLARHDERLAAYLDLMHVHRMSIPLDELTKSTPADVFASASLALTAPDRVDFDTVADAGLPAASLSSIVAALAWAERRVAGLVTERLARATTPQLRAIAIATLGARRSDPGQALAPTLADPSPLVRARAYRTSGLLGRADLMSHLRPGLADEDPECRFWSAWTAARMGAGGEPLRVLADIAWNNHPRAVRAIDILLRRLDVPQASAWLREFAKLPGRQRDLIRATGVIGDPLYIPWLIERMADLPTARLAGEAFSMITGLDLAYRDLDRRPPADFQSGPNDDPEDEDVELDEDENLPWPDQAKIGQWWTANRARFTPGTPYFLGAPKASADWLEALSDAFQRQRHAAALELAIRQPDKAMFEVRARGRLQRQMIARARGLI